MKVLQIILGLVLLGFLSYGGWTLKRSFNWYFGYESQVQEQIKEQTKLYKQQIKDLDGRIKVLEKMNGLR